MLQKNIDYIKKSLKQKLHRIKFPTKTSLEAYLYLHTPCPVELGASKDLPFLKYYNALEWESTSGLNAAKNIDYRKIWFKHLIELNFLQKIQWKHISIYPFGGGGSKDLHS